MIKKSLIVLAAACAAASSACAQSAVTIYGGVDMGLKYDKGGKAEGSAVTLESGQIYASRLGFKGVEKLGEDLSAFFILENGFAADTGAFTQGVLFGRQALVGLKGNWGTIKFGRQYTPLFWATNYVDPFPGALSAGDILRLFSSGGTRVNNSITYASPEIANFSSEFMYGLGEVADNAAAGRQLGMRAHYYKGPVLVTFGYHNSNNATATLSTKTKFAGAAYDFKVAKVTFAYATDKDNASLDTSEYIVGTTVPFGAHQILGSYMYKRDKITADANTKQYALGYLYELSKRTTFYTIGSHTTNDRMASRNVALRGSSGTLLNVGIAHTF
jgi:predicted porin